MILAPDEAADFFELLAALDTFSNRRLGLRPDISDLATMRTADLAARHEVRQALWRAPELIDAFVSSNDFGLPETLLDDARRFRHVVTGRFFCERVLKRHAMVIATTNPAVVYAIEGLVEPVDVVLSRHSPRGVGALFDASLIPWRGRIVWDGLVSIVPIYAGPGIRRAFKDEYIAAKAAGAIVTSLGEPPPRPARPRKPSRDWRPAVDEIILATSALGKTDTAQQAAAFSLLKASAAFARSALDGDHDASTTAKLERAWKRVIREFR